MEEHYDVIIVGCGPAGLAAGLYTSRSRYKVLLLGNQAAGGSIRGLEEVENYPGFPDGISGGKLGLEMMKQAMKYGLQFKPAEVNGIELKNNHKVVKATITGAKEATYYLAKAVIIAGGAQPKKLGVPGEKEFMGKGVSYCGVCDAPKFTGRVVAVAGGGDAGVTEALYLTRFASEITVIKRGPHLDATKILQERALANPKIKICCRTRIEAITGDDQVRGLELLNLSSSERTTLPVGGILIRIGLEPNTHYLKDLLSMDGEGFVLVNEELETSISGILAAGDIRHGSARQIATAVGDGVVAALSVDRLMKLGY